VQLEGLAEYADMDIALDPVPYNGGTTSLQAMWMGKPVVTQRGHNFVSRMGASFMTAAGLPEWVAEDDEGYVQMTQDRQALLDLKRGLRARYSKRSFQRAASGRYYPLDGRPVANRHCKLPIWI
jgi:predicted O-linked N-acetylglucosamine transferase (SPINDLY family)